MKEPKEREKLQEELLTRLKRIEGQVKGIHRMVEEQQACEAILTQIAAARAALYSLGIKILETHSVECLNQAFQEQNFNRLEELIKVLMRFTK